MALEPFRMIITKNTCVAPLKWLRYFSHPLWNSTYHLLLWASIILHLRTKKTRSSHRVFKNQQSLILLFWIRYIIIHRIQYSLRKYPHPQPMHLLVLSMCGLFQFFRKFFPEMKKKSLEKRICFVRQNTYGFGFVFQLINRFNLSCSDLIFLQNEFFWTLVWISYVILFPI